MDSETQFPCSGEDGKRKEINVRPLNFSFRSQPNSRGFEAQKGRSISFCFVQESHDPLGNPEMEIPESRRMG